MNLEKAIETVKRLAPSFEVKDKSAHSYNEEDLFYAAKELLEEVERTNDYDRLSNELQESETELEEVKEELDAAKEKLDETSYVLEGRL